MRSYACNSTIVMLCIASTALVVVNADVAVITETPSGVRVVGFAEPRCQRALMIEILQVARTADACAGIVLAHLHDQLRAPGVRHLQAAHRRTDQSQHHPERQRAEDRGKPVHNPEEHRLICMTSPAIFLPAPKQRKPAALISMPHSRN